MSAGSRLSRLLAMVPWLLAHDGVTIDDAARHFQVTSAEFERDLWLLVVSGLPGHGPDQLIDIDFWDDGVIHVIDPQTLDRPMRLTQDEIVALLLALRALAQVPGIVDRSAIHAASAKLEAALDTLTLSTDLPDIELGADESLTATLESALASGSALAMTYATASRDDVTERTVQPRQVRVIDGVGYLEAWCSQAGANRTFRLDRILAATPVASLDSTDPASDGAQADGAPANGAATIDAILDLEPAARWVLDVHAGAEVIPDERPGTEAKATRIRLPLQSLDWGTRLVLSLGGGATVVAPEELRLTVAATAESALARYSDHVG